MEVVYEVNDFSLALAIFALMAAATEAGFRLGSRSDKPAAQDTKSQHLTVEAGLLGVLGLLLGFTMAMALGRFEIRKQLILQEAQAIGSAYLLTQVLPVKDGTEIAGLLHLHRNTVLYRLRRIEEIGRLDLDNPDTRLNLQLSLRVREVLAAAGA